MLLLRHFLLRPEKATTGHEEEERKVKIRRRISVDGRGRESGEWWAAADRREVDANKRARARFPSGASRYDFRNIFGFFDPLVRI